MVMIQAVSDNTKSKSKEPEGNRHLRSWRMQKKKKGFLFRRYLGEDRTKEKTLQVPV